MVNVLALREIHHYLNFVGEAKVYHDTWITGYHFISLGSEDGNSQTLDSVRAYSPFQLAHACGLDGEKCSLNMLKSMVTPLWFEVEILKSNPGYLKQAIRQRSMNGGEDSAPRFF